MTESNDFHPLALITATGGNSFVPVPMAQSADLRDWLQQQNIICEVEEDALDLAEGQTEDILNFGNNLTEEETSAIQDALDRWAEL